MHLCVAEPATCLPVSLFPPMMQGCFWEVDAQWGKPFLDLFAFAWEL